MATKAKPKSKSTPKSKAKRANVSKPHTIPNHRFEVGSKVGIFPASEIGVERGLGREPIPKPTKTATVKKDGSVSVSGLNPGSYLAAAQVGEDSQWRYVQFTVK